MPKKKSKPNKLPRIVKKGIEDFPGLSMKDVKVNFNSNQPAQLQALAYELRNEIHIDPVQKQNTPHEVWHVVQQKQVHVQATEQMNGNRVNDEAGLEKEADEMGIKATAISPKKL